MKTPEDIKKALLMCSQNHSCTLSSCAYIEKGFSERYCRSIMEEDAFIYITQLEAEKKALQERIDLMMFQMRTSDYPCPMCKHFKTNCLDDPCKSCRTKRGYRLWEYKGLPKKGKAQ